MTSRRLPGIAAASSRGATAHTTHKRFNNMSGQLMFRYLAVTLGLMLATESALGQLAMSRRRSLQVSSATAVVLGRPVTLSVQSTTTAGQDAAKEAADKAKKALGGLLRRKKP